MAIFQITFMSACLARTVPLTVILPTDKKPIPSQKRFQRTEPYKTLYLLHGIVGSHGDWLYGTRIQRWAEERNLAVVMPSGDNMMYLDNPVDRYGEYVGKELVEFTRATFPLSRKREDTFIGGLSMGGFGALRNGLKYHETFGAIVALSAALVVDESLLTPVENPFLPTDREEYRHWVYGNSMEDALKSDINPAWLIRNLVKEGAQLPSIYMAVGDQDFLLEKNVAFHTLLNDLRVKHTYVQAPGAHDWDFWDSHIHLALDWLPLEPASAGHSSGNVK